VVHLRDRQLGPVPGAPAISRDADAAVVADDPPVGVQRIDPDVVVIPAGLIGAFGGDGAAAIERNGLAGSGEGEFVRAVGGRRHSRVVERPGDQVQVAADQSPRVAPVVRAPEDAGEGIGGSEVAVRTRLDQGIDAIRIVRRHGEPDLAERRPGQTGAFERRPGGAAVPGAVEAAARAAAGAAGSPDLDLPGGGVDLPRIVRRVGEIDDAGIRVDEQDVLPGRAAISGAEDPAGRFFTSLRPIGVAECRDQRGVGVFGMDDDAPDATGPVEAEGFEAVAGVG